LKHLEKRQFGFHTSTDNSSFIQFVRDKQYNFNIKR